METQDNLQAITITGNDNLIIWLNLIQEVFTEAYPESTLTYEEIIVFLINDAYNSIAYRLEELNELVKRGNPSIMAGIMDTVKE